MIPPFIIWVLHGFLSFERFKMSKMWITFLWKIYFWSPWDFLHKLHYRSFKLTREQLLSWNLQILNFLRQIREHFWQFQPISESLVWSSLSLHWDEGRSKIIAMVVMIIIMPIYIKWQCVGMSRKMSTSVSVRVSVCYYFSFLPNWYLQRR